MSILECHRNQPIMYCAALALSLFLDGARANLSLDHAALILSVIARASGSEAELRTSISIIMLLMVPIDSSRQELSNGCHIIILSNFDLIY